MGLRMKNLNITRVYWKIRFLERVTKNQYIGENCLKSVACFGQFADLRAGRLGEKEVGGIFEGAGWYPNAGYATPIFSFIFFKFYFLLSGFSLLGGWGGGVPHTSQTFAHFPSVDSPHQVFIPPTKKTNPPPLLNKNCQVRTQ